MQLSLALATTLLSALAAMATPVPATNAAAVVEARDEWPNTAAGYRARRRANTPTNADLLKRGLAPAKPRKLFGIKDKVAVAKRAVGAPAAAVPSSRAVQYDRDRCTNTADGSTAFVLTYTSVEDLANQCATLDQTSAAGPTIFVIYDRELDNCIITVQEASLTPFGCTADNGALYRF